METTTKTEITGRGQCRTCKCIFPLLPFGTDEFGRTIWNLGQERAEAGCPRCGASFKGWDMTWSPITIKATRTSKGCGIACETATSAVCKCECGGMAHGTRA